MLALRNSATPRNSAARIVGATMANGVTDSISPFFSIWIEPRATIRRIVDSDPTRNVLTLARAQDAISLWHLVQRVDVSLRGTVYDRLAALVPPPAAVTRRAVIALESRALEGYWTKIHQIHFRRMVLRGVKEVDPRTGTAKH